MSWRLTGLACRPAKSRSFRQIRGDAFGAHVFGFRVFWVNRLQQPDEYGLRSQVTELPGLQTLPDLLA